MSNWLNRVTEPEAIAGDWLADHRAQSLAKLKQQQWPTRKTENWRYLSLKSLEGLTPAVPDASLFTPEAITGLESIDIFIVNGELQSDFAAVAGLTITPWSKLTERQRAIAQQYFNQAKPERHLFGLANDVLASAGVFIEVAEGAQIEQPVRLVHWQNGGEAHSRHLVVLGKGAKACVIEQHMGDDSSFNTSFAEYHIGQAAKLEHYRFALQSGNAVNIGGCHFNLVDNSEMDSTLVGFGSDLARLDVDINHTGEHAVAKQNSIYLLAGKEVFDLHSNVEHQQPHGTTEENVRGIVGDHAKAIFNGRIHIHRHAQKTLAELNNRNLLLTRTAEINTKPELEIYADDVRCAHGATVAELDDKALYYMQSRGISEQDARIMLNFGFINELIDQMPLEPLAEWLREMLKDRFARVREQSEA